MTIYHAYELTNIDAAHHTNRMIGDGDVGDVSGIRYFLLYYLPVVGLECRLLICCNVAHACAAMFCN